MAINFDKVPHYIRKEITAPKKTLRNGSRGNSVKQVQEWLQYHKCRTAIDSAYGPATASCVKDFQKIKKLEQTGIVDKTTWDKLVAPMTNALLRPKIKKNETAPATVHKIAEQHVKQHPQEIGGANCGPWVRLYCSGNEGIEWAWCAGFVSLIMQQAYFYRGEKAPIKGSVSCDSLAAQAKEKDLFVAGSSIKNNSKPWSTFEGSCLFLRRRTDTDWTHTGIATIAEGSGEELVFHTIEGNTNDDGVREGYEACKRKRSFLKSNYDFISFVEIN